MKKSLFPFLLLSASACTQIPTDAYFNHGTPESLLDMSAEMVTVSLNSPDGQDELVSWLNQESPTRAELACTDGQAPCEQAKQALHQFAVPFSQAQDGRNSIALYYDRVLARDCENRFIDNSINPYNLNHPTFGCSVAANGVQMVTDKRQFVNPTLLDFADGEKTVKAYRTYIKSGTPPSQGVGTPGSGMTSVMKGSSQ